MKYLLLFILGLNFSCLSKSSQPDQSFVDQRETTYDDKLEKDTSVVTLEYYGWGCPCPQWITPGNKAIYESNSESDTAKNLDLFWHIIPANDSVKHPFDLIEDAKNMVFEFEGRFFLEPQLLGDEGEQGPAKTLLYHSLKQKGQISEDEKLLNETTVDKPLPVPDFEDFKKYRETSGVLSVSKAAKYKKPSDKGIIGFYTLFNKDREQDEKREYIGELVVFVHKDKDWKFDDPDQSFLGIRLQKPGIKLYGDIEVGRPIQVVKSQLREPKLTNDSLIVYRDGKGTVGVFETDEGIITGIYYGLLNIDKDDTLTIEDIIDMKNSW
ncbi:MAG: hypothetical protein AAFX87_12520 [Bacteroidota bacterium]